MTAIDRYTLIEAAANGVPLWGTDSDADGYTFSYERGAEEIIADTLPVIARELLAPLRELHHEVVVYANFAMTTGRRECVCGKSDCPTRRLLDQIEADCGGDDHA